MHIKRTVFFLLYLLLVNHITYAQNRQEYIKDLELRIKIIEGRVLKNAVAQQGLLEVIGKSLPNKELADQIEQYSIEPTPSALVSAEQRVLKLLYVSTGETFINQFKQNYAAFRKKANVAIQSGPNARAITESDEQRMFNDFLNSYKVKTDVGERRLSKSERSLIKRYYSTQDVMWKLKRSRKSLNDRLEDFTRGGPPRGTARQEIFKRWGVRGGFK